MRILVCGSRDFDDREVVFSFLQGIYESHSYGYMTLYEDDITIIDGECPFGGADQLAYEWTKATGPHCGEFGQENGCASVFSERFPPKARTAQEYHARDRAMVDSGIDLAIGFVNKPFAESRGTKYTIEYARSKDVKTIVIEVI